ncbi:MAG: HU family DNA-binding protein [Gammaproteobacteria bacterium]|nr:MAG: integration host factor subunit alpha [Gammaproteobacteria bacterium TMED104]GIR06074.1 MAG: integration host factor subunit alpha [Gammaproteobacteria bacterium]
MTLTKKELAQNLSDQTELSLADAKKFVDLFFDTIKEQLNSGKTVKLSGFGTFDIVQTKERVGRNPKTMEEFPIPSKRKVKFTVSPKVKKSIN